MSEPEEPSSSRHYALRDGHARTRLTVHAEDGTPVGEARAPLIADSVPWGPEMVPIRPPAPTPEGIKAEAARRILKVAPDWKQRNLTARGVELVLALVRNKVWTAAEAVEAEAIQAVWDRIKAIRAASDGLEPALPQDFADDRYWP